MDDNIIVENKLRDSIQRYEWVDIMKFLGIYAIYIGHTGFFAGHLYPFVFLYHVPLFFMVSGFFATNSIKLSFKESFIKKIRTLFIPYIVFCILNMITITITNNTGLSILWSMCKQSFWAKRNYLYAGALWFIACLFIISVFFDVISRIIMRITKRYFLYIVFAISLGLFIMTQTLFKDNPIVSPTWFFSIDNGMYYFIFYVFGAIIFPHIKDKKLSSFSMIGRTIFILLSFLAFAITIILFFEGSDYLPSKIPFNIPRAISMFFPLINAFIIIYVIFLFSKFLLPIKLLPKIGKNTLILCGTEAIITLIFKSVSNILGNNINVTNPFEDCTYILILILMSYYTLVPLINKFLKPIMYGKKA